MGLYLERRWARGFSIGFGYDAWFLNSSAVFELGFMHLLSGTFRYYLFNRTILHPFVGASLMGLAFGDVGKATAFGGGLSISVGTELEITRSLALTFHVPFYLLDTLPFTTERDGVERGGQGVNTAFAIYGALSLLITE